MLKGGPIYNVPFTKVIERLGVEVDEITVKDEEPSSLSLKRAPLKIQKIVLKLREFCAKSGAALLLFGSQATNRAGSGSDWDFGIYFTRAGVPKNFSSFKQDLIDRAFPYRIDIVVLNEAPPWFWESLVGRSLTLQGQTPEQIKRKTA